MTISVGIDSLKTRKKLDVNGKEYYYYSLQEIQKKIGKMKNYHTVLKYY